MNLHKNFFVPIIFIFITASNLAQQSIKEKILEIAIIDEKVMMPMRDGIRLATDIYLPKTEQKVPIIFSKTPYNKFMGGWYRTNKNYGKSL
jgi:predicted acyl esterase